MRNLIGILILGFLSQLAVAQEVNLLQNPNFESRTSRWVKTGSSTFSIESASPIEGKYSAIWNASATGEFFRSSTYTIPAGLKGTTCAIQMRYLWDTGTSGHIVMNVDDGTNNIAQLSLEPTSGGVPRTAQTNFTCPTSGTLRFELESTANADAITVDQMFLGNGKNTVQLSQATLFATARHPGTTNCLWSRTNTALGGFAVDADCPTPTVTGAGAAPLTKIPAIRLLNVPPGNYYVVARGSFIKNNNDSGSACYFRLHDGTNAGGTSAAFTNSASSTIGMLSANFAVTSPQASLTVEVQVGSGAGACDVILSNTDLSTLEFSVYKFPAQSAEALTLETTGWFFDGNIGGANPNLGILSVPTYSHTTDGGLDLVINSGSVSGKIPCTGGNPASGLTCSAGNEVVGVTLDIPYAGMFEACFDFIHSIGVSTGAIASVFQVVRTEDTLQTIVEEGKQRTGSTSGTANTTNEHPNKVCGTFNVPSAGSHAFKLYHEQAVSGTVAASVIAADRNASNGQRDIHVTIRPINQQMPAPVFTEIRQKVESNATGQRIERVSVGTNCTVSPCTITSQSGSWVTSITRAGTGDYIINFASGIFSVAPVCVANGHIGAGATKVVSNSGLPTTTSWSFACAGASDVLGDCKFNIMCMGPK